MNPHDKKIELPSYLDFIPVNVRLWPETDTNALVDAQRRGVT